MPLGWTRTHRVSALMNGVFVGVGIIFLIWGATDIAFPITEMMNAAVFGLMRIILGIISLSVGVGVESVQWAKLGRDQHQEPIQDTSVDSAGSPTTQPVTMMEKPEPTPQVVNSS